MGVRCFWLEPKGWVKVKFRRYSSGPEVRGECPSDWGYHNAEVVVGEQPAPFGDRGPRGYGRDAEAEERAMPGWPTHCSCGYRFTDEDTWQVNGDLIYTAADGTETTLRDAEPGAMWNAYWMGDIWKASDGRCLVVKLPNGREWMIDSRASNCTRPDEDHDCWCRHGEPPDLTVDKNPEPGRSTCQAGAGSILAGDYHGFLRGGEFT